MDGHQLRWALAPNSVDMAQRLRTHLDRRYRTLSATSAPLPSGKWPD
ncbi:hypothetical protein [Streptomyces sp. NPDC057381]